ncbi:vitamin D-binding protein [Varanus komodoensis]|uniref:vitamin D-binding protein n=1 Tax=Varanus komodoensis TaxID=61221 RepID=UPI001CF76978|nr:vitamin D-binding protein [Varanus komodoensis]
MISSADFLKLPAQQHYLITSLCQRNSWKAEMKTSIVSTLLFLLTYSHAMERGRDYLKDKICQQFSTMGKEKFHALTLVLNSKKYCQATFEEVNSIVSEIVALAEKCCVEGASEDCYLTESSALSAKSCAENSPFPKLPGTAACCAQEGLARKLCLAALKHPPKEFMTYVEPQGDEVCEAFKKDPKEFTDRFLYQFSSDHSCTPLPLLLAYTNSYLSTVGSCCNQKQPSVCLLREALQKASLRTLMHLSNKACSRYAFLGQNKTRLSYLITLTQRSPNALLEDVLYLAEDASNLLSKCCDSLEGDCIQSELFAFTLKLCSKLSAHDQRVADCCSQHGNCTIYQCIDSLPWDKLPKSLDLTPTNHEAICGKGQQQEFDRMIFHFARTFTRAPEGILTLMNDAVQKVADMCCQAEDVRACFDAKNPEATADILEMLSKGAELCNDYTDHSFQEFKNRLRESYLKKFPTATEDAVSAQVEQRANFASICCHLNAPPSYCGMKAP